MKEIIFIAGRGRSGSTLLGKALDSIPDTFHIGEIRYFSQIGYIEDRECECGKGLTKCLLWGDIIKKLSMNYNLNEVYNESKNLPSHLRLYSNKVFGLDNNSLPASYISFISDLYDTIYDVSGCEYVVDSSKFPVHLLALLCSDRFKLKVIHLTRDPRGTSHSWSKERQGSQGQSSELIGQHSFLKEALKWRLWNRLLSRSLDDIELSIHVKWEDFITEPAAEIEKIIHQLQLCLSMPVFETPSHILLNKGHAFWGNSSRRLSGVTKIRKDEEWTKEMGELKRHLIFHLAGASRYGYKV